MKPVDSLTFRPAVAADAEALTALCRAAKAHWRYPAAWLDAWRGDLRVTPEYIATGWVGVAEVSGETVGFYGLKRAADGWYLEHLWLEPKWIGRGLGRSLFAESAQAARALGATELLIKADPNAEGFYLKMGACRTRVETYLLLGTIKRDLPHFRFSL